MGETTLPLWAGFGPPGPRLTPHTRRGAGRGEALDLGKLSLGLKHVLGAKTILALRVDLRLVRDLVAVHLEIDVVNPRPPEATANMMQLAVPSPTGDGDYKTLRLGGRRDGDSRLLEDRLHPVLVAVPVGVTVLLALGSDHHRGRRRPLWKVKNPTFRKEGGGILLL